jgi:hypothetical protein
MRALFQHPIDPSSGEGYPIDSTSSTCRFAKNCCRQNSFPRLRETIVALESKVSRSYPFAQLKWEQEERLRLRGSCEIDRGQKLRKFRLETRSSLSLFLLTFIFNISQFDSYRSSTRSDRYTYITRLGRPAGTPSSRRLTTPFHHSSFNKTNSKQPSFVSLSASTAHSLSLSNIYKHSKDHNGS